MSKVTGETSSANASATRSSASTRRSPDSIRRKPSGGIVLPGSAAGKVYETLVGSLLTAEQDRRKSVEGRGATILTTSTTMLTLIFGLTIILTGKDYVFRNHNAVCFLTLALAAFVVSAAVAIFVQTYGFKYAVTSTKTLESLVEEVNWDRTEDDARRMWVNRQVQTIKSLRQGNNRKAGLAMWSLGFEVLAIALLALSVGLELHTRL